MRAHLTDAVKNQVKQTTSELVVIPGGINRSLKAKLRASWEQWMTEGEHTFTKTGRQRRATYATICQWIVDAKVSVSTVVRAFTKAGIITEVPGNSGDTDTDTDSDNDERELGYCEYANV